MGNNANRLLFQKANLLTFIPNGGLMVNKKTYDIFSIKRVTRKFLEVSRCSRAKQRQRNVQKTCAASHCAKLGFAD